MARWARPLGRPRPREGAQNPRVTLRTLAALRTAASSRRRSKALKSNPRADTFLRCATCSLNCYGCMGRVLVPVSWTPGPKRCSVKVKTT
eukprot:6959247-Prymnesium_polylepis.1